jgi:hypothetical protein
MKFEIGDFIEHRIADRYLLGLIVGAADRLVHIKPIINNTHMIMTSNGLIPFFVNDFSIESKIFTKLEFNSEQEKLAFILKHS